MVKLLLAILVFIILMAVSFSMYGGDDSQDKANSGTPSYSSPADTVEGANQAVDQTQNLQDDVNSKAAEQLGN